MNGRKRLQFSFATRRQFQENAPAILGIDASIDQPKLRHPNGQFDGGVMADQQRAGKVANRREIRSGKPLDREQRLMLLRGQPRRLSSALTEGKELAQLQPKRRQRLVVDRTCLAAAPGLGGA